MMDRIYLENFLKNNFSDQEISFEGEGWSSFAFTVGENIIRFSKTNNIGSYEKERYICDFIRDNISFQIPRIKIVHGDINYSIHKKLIGEKWNFDSYFKLSDKDKSLFCEDIARFFYELHSIDYNKIDKNIITKPQKISFDNFVNFLKDDFSAGEIDKMYKYYCDIFNSESDFVLAHQDFNESNSLVDKNHRLKVVFDFGNCGIAERCLEFRPLYYRTAIGYDNAIFKKVVEIYENIFSTKIDVFRVKLLNDIEILDCLNYLSSTGLRKKMIKEWNERIEKARKIFLRIK